MLNPYQEDSRLVLTLDAGGTNFNFAAFSGGEIVGDSLNLTVQEISPSNSLEESLNAIVKGFEFLIKQFDKEPSAISFSFPGPCDYKNGVTLNEGNLPAFSGAVALGPFLSKKFNLPVYMNNDGDLYTYGEACFGLASKSRFNSLVGITLGTGVGGGFCFNKTMLRGETSNALEVWTTRNGIDTNTYTEEGLGKRALIRFYGDQKLTPEDLFEIAIKNKEGDSVLALKAFEKYGRVLGELIADLITLFDAPIVLGGGVSKAYKLFTPSMLETISSSIKGLDGSIKKRVVQNCYLIDSEESLNVNLDNDSQIKSTVIIPGTDEKVEYMKSKDLPVFIGSMNTNQATQLGAYSYALHCLDIEDN